MAIELFSRLESWKLCGESGDVRGKTLADDAGGSLGTVRDFIVNTETGEVERLVLDTLAEYPVASVERRGEELRLRREEFMTHEGAAAEAGISLRLRCERM